MPQCPHCQAAYEEGQRYCNNCGSFLMHPEEGDIFCPQCGVRVSPGQQYCHECDAPLKGEVRQGVAAPAGEAAPPAPPPAPQGLPPWVIGALAGAGIIIILLLIVIFSRIGTTPAPPAAESQAPAALATPGAPAKSLQDQLEEVLATLRNAQLQKNINAFMSVYSQTYHTYDLKRQETLKYWENYDFTNLVFTVDKVQAIDPDHAVAQVIWYLDVRNRETKELSSDTQRFQVKFVKENGKWRISGLQEEQ